MRQRRWLKQRSQGMPVADPQSLIPQASDEDIDWVCRVMNLRDFDQPRQDFLRARATLDVSACPGSGKTTLIVAKLAIMARKWPHSTKGICVLSHTNAAREEIQRRLRSTVVGQQLLSYPHFIDTIHSFVNRFLALPWLNSNGYPPPVVDDDATSAFRRRVLPPAEYSKIKYFLAKKHSGFDQIRLKDPHLQIDLGNKPFPAKPSAEMHQIAKRAVEASSNAGYFCYDEMFIWANALISKHPAVSTWLQRRFPLVIIDEMQDTSESQVKILEFVFPRSGSEVALQRVGDPNQAIYDGASAGSAAPGAFPDPAKFLTIPKSFRFGPQIAALASPFAVDAVGPNGLQGAGPRVVGDASECCSNAVFIFPDDSPEGILDAYGQHVLSNFSDDALAQGDVAAVGARHQASEIAAGHAHFPKTVPHYWSGYTAEVARREPHPRTLVQYVRVAQALVRDRCDFSPGVDKIASGLIRLARRVGGADALGRRAPNHRTLVAALALNLEATAAYRRLLRTFLVEWETPTSASWTQRQNDIFLIMSGLTDAGATTNPADSFLCWDEAAPPLTAPAATSQQSAGPNIYRVLDGAGRIVDIRVGSVHSVKGQTHLATLLMSTYYHDHSAKRMLPWLLGDNINLCGAGNRDRDRLRQTYVAMTRPSHLVCLAIPRSAFDGDVALSDQIATLRNRGWAVADLVDGAAHWQK